jgi:hypothetical protein
MRVTRGGALALLAGATLAAGAAPGGASLGSRAGVCSLLREREVERVLAASVTKTKPVQPPVGASLCSWTVDGTHGGRLVAVYLARGAGAKRGYEDASDVYTGDARERVTGLGRRAFYAVPVRSVYVLRDSTLVYVQNVDGSGLADPVELRDDAVALARLVVRRL